MYCQFVSSVLDYQQFRIASLSADKFVKNLKVNRHCKAAMHENVKEIPISEAEVDHSVQ
jgi:hypothetical protein